MEEGPRAPLKPRKLLRLRKAAALLGVLAASLAVAVILGEGVCRLAGLGDIILYEQGLYVRSDDPDLGYELKHGYAGHSYAARVTVDSYGFRGPEYTREPLPGTYRIACVGDSFTFGMGVDYEQSWPSLLEHKIAPPAGFASVEVINAGVSGYNLKQYCAEIIDKIIPLKPHLVIMGLVGNDLAPSFSADHGYLLVPRKKTSLPIPGKRWLQTHSYLYQFLNMKYQALWTAALEKKNPRLAHELVWQDALSEEWDIAEKRLVQCRQELERQGIGFVAVKLLIPPGSPLPSILRRAGVRNFRVKLLDSERLEDGHPNPAGHKSIASQVASRFPHFL